MKSRENEHEKKKKVLQRKKQNIESVEKTLWSLLLIIINDIDVIQFRDAVFITTWVSLHSHSENLDR